MPYIGNTIRAADDYRLIDDISSGFNGSATSFALQVAGSSPVPFPKSPQQVLISVNGVIQEPDPTGSSGFNLVGTNIVFSSAPTNGHAFFGIIYATADYLNAGGNFPAGSLGAPSITFIGDENSGLYRKGSGSVGFVSDATEIANFDSNGITISSGNLIIPESIIHGGDSDTKIKFGSANNFSVETGGSERVGMSGTEVVFNESGADTDFRIEGDNNANLFKVDAGNDRIGIGTSSPTSSLHVSVGSSGTNSSAGFNEFCIEGGNEDIGMCFLSPAANNRTHTIAFGDSNNNNAGKIVYNHSTDDLTITASDNIILTGDGVGIGTTTPRTELDLHDGQLSFSHRTDYSIRFYNGEGNNWSSINNPRTADGTNGSELEFRVAQGIAMHMATDGKIGIGTTSPTQLLNLSQATTGAPLLIQTTNNNTRAQAEFKGKESDGTEVRLRVGADGDFGGNIFTVSNHKLGFATNNAAPQMMLDENGNFGVGLTPGSSAGKVQINGGLRIAGSASASDTNSPYIYRTSGVDNLNIATGGAQRFQVASDGKVFIDRTHASATTGNHPAVDIDTHANGTAGADFATGIDFRVAGVHKKRLAITNTDSSAGTGDWVFYRDNGNNEGLRIKADGKVGINTSAPEAKFSVNDQTNPDIGLMYQGTSGGHKSRYLFIDKRGFINAQVANNLQDDGSGTGAAHLEFATSHAGTLSTAMAIDRYGKAAIGDELFTQHGGLFQVVHTGGGNLSNDNLCYFETNAQDWILKLNYTAAGLHYHMQFEEDGVTRGQIYGNDGSNVTYASGSDYRFKENIVDMTGTEGIDICKKLKPRKYNWIDNRKITGKINTVDGFIAHEVQEAGVLGAATGVKDEVNEDGSIKPQMLDYGQMTPVLAAAIKGLIDKVETLETKVAALEAA